MKDFFLKLLDTQDFPARWHCGNWTEFLGWLHIVSDLAIFGAYAAIPLSIAYYVLVKRQEIVFPKLYWFFAIFILSCGLTHLIDATVFWHPWYRLAGLVKGITAIASWATVVILVRVLPQALALPGTVRLNAEFQQEIEERRRSEEALRQSSAQLNMAMTHSRLGYWVVDMQTDLATFSPRAAEIYGIQADIPHPRASIRTYLHPDDQVSTPAAVSLALNNHADYDIEFRLIRPSDGRLVWVSARGRAEYKSDGKPLRMIGTVQDITERKLIEAEREQLLTNERLARMEAEHAGQMKDQFLATLSHELRTPLNAILGWSHLLKEDDDEEQRREGLAIIERNTRMQSQMVDDLLDMNRIITGKVRLDLKQVDLQEVVRAALDSVRPSAQSKSILLETSLETVPAVRGDPTRLQQIIWNLLTNAIKFTPVDGRITISLKSIDAQVEIAVSDTGPGIAPEFLPHVFDRFRQADSSITRKHGGLGLGLAIVKNLTEMHGGSVVAENAGNQGGATFRLRLPVSPETEAGPGTIPSAESATVLGRAIQPLTRTENSWPGIRGARILVVEDDPDSLALLCQVFERQGATVHPANRGAHALTALDSATFDLLISDIGMPEMDGFTLLENVRRRADDRNGKIPAIALTAFARAEDRQRALAVGFNVFLSKPINPVDLLKVVNQYTQAGNPAQNG